MHLRPWLIAGLLVFALGTQAAPPNGARVLAQWGPDGLWYPARVNSSEGSKVTVNFDDGDVAAVNPSQVRALDWQPGTRVSCNWHGANTTPARSPRLPATTYRSRMTTGTRRRRRFRAAAVDRALVRSVCPPNTPQGQGPIGPIPSVGGTMDGSLEGLCPGAENTRRRARSPRANAGRQPCDR